MEINGVPNPKLPDATVLVSLDPPAWGWPQGTRRHVFTSSPYVHPGLTITAGR